jgi:type I site-specific restriction-modification system R (restriction) subunit
LRKLLNDGIRSRNKANIVETRAFSERLEDAVARYHANAITTAEVLQELIQLAKDIRAARQRGEESGLSDEEIAFYDALAENDSAVQAMGDDKLKVIAHELLVSLKGKRLGGLGASRFGTRPDARAGQAHPAQVRLPARSAGRSGADGVAAGRGAVG